MFRATTAVEFPWCHAGPDEPSRRRRLRRPQPVRRRRGPRRRPISAVHHVDGLAGLRYLVAAQSTTNLATAIRNAAVGVAGDGALEAIGTAYRHFAHTNAGQFASTFLPPTSDNDDLANANRSLLDVFVLVYRAMGLTPDHSQLAARSTRSAIHGFCALELASGTTPNHDAEYHHLLETLRRGLRPDPPTKDTITETNRRDRSSPSADATLTNGR